MIVLGSDCVSKVQSEQSKNRKRQRHREMVKVIHYVSNRNWGLRVLPCAPSACNFCCTFRIPLRVKTWKFPWTSRMRQASELWAAQVQKRPGFLQLHSKCWLYFRTTSYKFSYFNSDLITRQCSSFIRTVSHSLGVFQAQHVLCW